MKKILILCILLTGCGSNSKPVTTTSTVPNMAGTWTGTINLQGSTPDLKVVLTEDSSGNLSGTAVSASCNFNVAVTGAIYTNYTFSVQAQSPSTLLLAGSLSNNNVDAQGSVSMQTGCSTAGAPFALGR